MAKEEERVRAQKEYNRLKRLNPYDDEIVTCGILIQYLSNDSGHKEKPRPVVQHFNAAAFAKPGMQQFKRSAAEEDAWLMGSKKKKAPKQKTEQPKQLQQQPIKSETTQEHDAEQQPTVKPKTDRLLPAMPVARLQAFDKISIAPPLRQSDVAACLEELKKKKAHYESFAKTIKQVIAEEVQEEELRRRAYTNAYISTEHVNDDQLDSVHNSVENCEGNNGANEDFGNTACAVSDIAAFEGQHQGCTDHDIAHKTSVDAEIVSSLDCDVKNDSEATDV
jgi:hypothetical protein